jgi:hypothetical protein
MADVVHNGAFIRFAGLRKRVRGPRGDVVRLAQWHVDGGRRLPPLRNRADVQRWALEVKGEEFVSAADRMWREFCRTLPEAERAVALSRADLDAGARREALECEFVAAWAEVYGERDVTAALLCEVPAACEAIALMFGCAGCDDVSPKMMARAVSLIGEKVRSGWQVRPGAPDRHSKTMRWRLETAEGQPSAKGSLPLRAT